MKFKIFNLLCVFFILISLCSISVANDDIKDNAEESFSVTLL